MGLAVALFFAFSAASSVVFGQVAECLGSHWSMEIATVGSATSLLRVVVFVRSWPPLVGCLVVGELANVVAHPATHLSLAREMPPGRQGFSFEIKQAAIPIATYWPASRFPFWPSLSGGAGRSSWRTSRPDRRVSEASRDSQLTKLSVREVVGFDVAHTESGCILRYMDKKRSSKKSESERLEGLYRKAADPVLRTHLLMVWRISVGDSVGEVAEMVGYSRKWTTEIAGVASQVVWRLWATATTAIPAPRTERCSTRTEKRSLWRLCGDLLRLVWAEGCGADRRWRVGSHGEMGWRRCMYSGVSST